MNKNGFTLVELIIVVAIMGLIAVIAFPAIVNLQVQQKEAKYYAYEDAAVETAKLYTDQAKDDIGGKQGCFTITKDQLVATGLLDEFEDTATTGCDFVIQYTVDELGHENYKIQMWCEATDLEEYPNGYTYDNREEVKLDDNCVVVVPDGEYCRYTEKEYLSDFGNCVNGNTIAECGGGIQSREYKLVSIYDNKIDCSDASQPFVETRSCNTNACFEADGLTVTSISKNTEGTTYNGGLDVNLKFDHVDGREMYISTTGYENGGTWQTIDNDYDLNLKTLNNSYSLNGQQIKIYVTIKDVYGNTVNLNAVNYTFHNECSTSNTEDIKTTWSGCSEACGGGIDTATITNRDKVTLASCPDTYTTQSCNTHSCLEIDNLKATSNVSGYNSTNVKLTFTNNGGTTMVLKAGNTTVYSGTVNTNLSVNLASYGFTMNGGNVAFTLTVYASDGSSDTLSFSYKLYQECSSLTYTYSSWSSCSNLCGAGTQTRTRYNKDSKTGKSCSTTAQSQGCTTSTYAADHVQTGLCSAACGGGTVSVTYNIRSRANNGICSSGHKTTQSCNTQSCTSSGRTICVSQTPCLATYNYAKNNICQGSTAGIYAGNYAGYDRYYVYPQFYIETGQPVSSNGNAVSHCTFSSGGNIVVNGHHLQGFSSYPLCPFNTSSQLHSNALFDSSNSGLCRFYGLPGSVVQKW